MNLCKFILGVVFTTALISVSGNEGTHTKIDSAKKAFPGLEGPDRLNALFLIYEHTLEVGELDAELNALYPYLEEARRQNNDRETGYALMQRLCMFYNYDMEDSLLYYYPESVEFFGKNGDWASYYFAALLKVQSYIYTNRPALARTAAQQLYDDARLSNNDYGRGATAYILGDVRYRSGSNDEARSYMNEAIERLEDEVDPTILFKAYDRLWEIYYDEKQYNEALTALQKWETAINKHFLKPNEEDDYLSAQTTSFYCWCGMAEVYARLGMFPQARAYILKAEDMANGKSLYINFLYSAKSVYFEEMGDYEAAIEWYRRTIPEEWDFSGPRAGYERASVFARLLTSGGRYQEATGVYEEALKFADEIQSVELETQLQDLEKLYQIDKTEARARTIQIIASIVILALLAVFAIYFIYSFRLRKKNKALSEQLKEVNRLRSWQLAHLAQAETDANVESSNSNGNSSKKNEELVWLACRRMVEDKLFRDPALNRKQLADALGTNENYLAAAIREINEGQTVGDFINGFRLDYACGMITDCPHMTLEVVAQESGLVTRSTLFRLFLKKFGMSPSQYRAEQIKERKSG